MKANKDGKTLENGKTLQTMINESEASLLLGISTIGKYCYLIDFRDENIDKRVHYDPCHEGFYGKAAYCINLKYYKKFDFNIDEIINNLKKII